jgi:acyl-CoA dehydrogenase
MASGRPTNTVEVNAMAVTAPPASAAMTGSDFIAPDCRGSNFFDIDRSLQGLLDLYMPASLRAHMAPHFRRLGEIAGARLDDLARLANRHTPILHPRDAAGRDADWLEFHPAYREMERIGYGDFGIHCMSRKDGVLGWPGRVPPVAKYVFQYIFAQSEFGLLCPISATETSAVLIERYGDASVKARFLPGMQTQDMARILMGAQFMTEKSGGSDVGRLELVARHEQGQWRLYGEKWFCSCADGDVALLLARPEGAPAGSRGLGLFALPRHLDDGSRNAYRIIRLKDKLGTRSMASGEIVFEGAIAYPLGVVVAGPNRGLKQMMDQVNLSRLSHGVRAAGMMRRCLNESLLVAASRIAFGEPIIHKPLLRRQLMKLLVPTEQVLSFILFTAVQLERDEAGDEHAAALTRILTPLLKFRSCRDNISVATGAMEVRGGNGFIEDWVNPRLVRDALTGVLWEGTSNINALDVVTRAVAKVGAHKHLAEELLRVLEETPAVPPPLRQALSSTLDRAVTLAEQVARIGNETLARQASSALYHITSAVLLASEGGRLGERGGDARRLVLARMVLDHRLRPRDPLAIADDDDGAVAALLSDDPLPLDRARALSTPA